MPIDPSILLQGQPIVLPDALNSLAKVSQIQGIQNQNRMADLSFQQAEDARKKEQGLNSAYAAGVDPVTGKIDSSKVIGNLASGGFGSAIPAAQKGFSEAELAQYKVQKEKADLFSQHLGLIGQTLGGVKDQASYDAALASLRSNLGPDAGAQMPAQYDPSIVQQAVAKAMSTKDQLDQQQKDLDYKLGLRKQDEVERNNRAGNAVAQGQLGVAQGNLGVAKQRLAFDQSQPKGQYDAANGIIVDTRTGQSRPVTGPDGQPIQVGNNKMTEDQGKATGWLIQAENAFANMKGAVTRTAAAAKPGFNDAIASIPSLGLGEAIANNMRSSDRQQFLQGASSLSEALLRAATGAGVNENEARQKVSELTPVSGDTDANIKQKMAAIPLYIESLKVRAGPGAKKAADVLSNQKTPAAAPSGGKPSLNDIFGQ